MESIFANWEAIDITKNNIKQLHRDLLVHSAKDERHRSEYNTNPNNVSSFDKDGNEIVCYFQDGITLRHAAPNARADTSNLYQFV